MTGRSQRVRLPALAALALAVTALAAAAAGAQEPGATAPVTTAAPPAAAAPAAPATAQIRGYGAILTGGNQASASAASETEREGHAAGAVGDAAGSATAAVDVRASGEGAEASADGTVVLTGVSLLGGRVTAASVRMAVTAGTGPGGRRAGITEAVAEGLTVDGVPVSAAPGARVEIAGVGTLVLFEQVASGPRVRANALRLEVSEAGGAVAPGATVVLGHLDAAAQAARARPATAPGRPDPPPETRPREPEPPPAAPAPVVVPPSPPPALGLPRQEAPFVPVQGAGYVFPVYGGAGYSDDYGAPRPVTGWHHGVDLFAATGTPVLAIADGTLSQVGVNALGGNRLWLTDDAGNEFYYAHLSAYVPEAVEGARVQAGQVIGFVGNTGQAITTPPHLHLEIHPAGGDSVNPYPYLLAWQNGTDIPRAFVAAAFSTDAAPVAGATLVGIERAVDEAPPTEGGLAAPTR